jgi:hypothetical protein
MKRKTLIIVGIILSILICIYTGFLILAYGYGGGKSIRPVKPNLDLISLEKEIKAEVNSDRVSIDTPRNYEIDNCDKYGFQKQDILIYINNDSLKNNMVIENYVINVNRRLQKIFPYDKKCYDSVIIETRYFDNNIDSTIDKRFSFPMLK